MEWINSASVCFKHITLWPSNWKSFNRQLNYSLWPFSCTFILLCWFYLRELQKILNNTLCRLQTLNMNSGGCGGIFQSFRNSQFSSLSTLSPQHSDSFPDSYQLSPTSSVWFQCLRKQFAQLNIFWIIKYFHNIAGSSGYSPDDPLLISEQGEVQDGHYFIKVTLFSFISLLSSSWGLGLNDLFNYNKLS